MWWIASTALAASPGILPAGTTSVQIEVVGALADVRITRGVTNPLDWPIDAELTLPIPPAAAIDRLTVRVADRVLEGYVDDRSAAAQTYQEASAAGQIGALLEEGAPGTVVQRIANVPAGAEVEVEVHLVQPVDRIDGRWELSLPLTVVPRFSVEGDDTLYTSDRGDLDLSVRVRGAIPVAWIESPSHPTVGHLEGNDGWIALADAAADRDLVVRWGLAGVAPEIAAWRGDDHGVVLIEPPRDDVVVTPPPQDVVLLVDTSDSTAGPVSAQLAEVVGLLLEALRPADRFTLLTFDDVVQGVAVRRPPDSAEIRAARARLAGLPIGGGTQLALALRFALAVPRPEERPLTVVLLSDAAVADELPVLRQILASNPARVHTVGVGVAAHRWLLEEIARLGGGIHAPLGPTDQAEGALATVIDALPGPILTDLTIDWGSETLEDPPPDLYPGQPRLLHFRSDLQDRVRVAGRYAGQPFSTEVWPTDLSDPRPVRVAWGQAEVAAAVRRTLQGDPDAALAGRNAALDYQLVSPWTSMVAVDGRPLAATGEHAVAMAVPLTVPPGRSYQTMVSMAGTVAVSPDLLPQQSLDHALAVGRPILGGLPWPTTPLPRFGPPDALSVAAGPRVPWIDPFEARPQTVVQAGRPHRVLAEVRGVGVWPAGPSVSGRLAVPFAGSRAAIAASFAHDTRPLPGATATFGAASGAVAVEPHPLHRLEAELAGDWGKAQAAQDTAAWGGGTGAATWTLTPRAPLELMVSGYAAQRRWAAATSDRQGSSAELVTDTQPQVTWRFRGDHTRWSTPEVDLDALSARPEIAISGTGGVRAHLGIAGALAVADDASVALALPDAGLDAEAGRTQLSARVHREASDAILPASLSPRITARRWIATGDLSHRLRFVEGQIVVRGTAETLPFVASPLALAPIEGEDVVRNVLAIETWLRSEANPTLILGHIATATPEDPDRVADPRAPWVAGFLDPHRRHRLVASAVGTLYLGRHPHRIAGRIEWRSPIAGGAPWLDPVWVATASVAQGLEIRTHALWLEASISTAQNAPSFELWPVEAQLLLPGPAEPPLRATVGLRGQL